jgi:hypothetical protein
VDQEIEDVLSGQNVEEQFKQYVRNFIQRQPRYAVKQIGKSTWRTKKRALSDKPIKAHLEGQYYVGVLGKWYPPFAILDIDNRDRETTEEIRESLRLDTDNSMLLSSESKDSYHLLFRPSYNDKPPTLRLLNEVLKPFALDKSIEVYPQANKPIRLPFGHKQKPLDMEYITLRDWQELLYWFNKLDYLELKEIPYQQLRLDLDLSVDRNTNLSTYQEGKFLYQNGLMVRNSRNDSQFKVIYYLWRNNIPLETTINVTWQWIKTKHNNLSKDILNSPGAVKKEIERQANKVYSDYEFKQVYPDDTHNNHKGYLTKADIEDILMITKASLPKTKFCYNLIKYCYPRRFNTFINVHSDKLKEWSKKGYQAYLKELAKKGILKRFDSYQVDNFSKSIKVKWNYKNIDNAILVDHRAPEDFSDTVKASYKPEEFKELLKKAGAKRTNAIMAVKSVFESVKKVDTYNNY